MLNAYYEVATPLVSRRFGGDVEMFMGDGMMASFNSRGDQPDHAVRAAGARARAPAGAADALPTTPRLAAAARRRQQRRGGRPRDGRHGYVAYALGRRHRQHAARGWKARRPSAAC